MLVGAAGSVDFSSELGGGPGSFMYYSCMDPIFTERFFILRC